MKIAGTGGNGGHTAYSDDSGSADKRYRCLSLVSGPIKSLENLREKLRACLNDFGVTEIKFEDVRGHAPKMQCAARFLCLAVKSAASTNIRVDVLVWDQHDSRHSIRGRDDDANVRMMYYKLLVHAGRQWKKAAWTLCPDEQAGVDWEILRDYVNRTPLSKDDKLNPGLFPLGARTFNLQPISPRISCEEPVIQCADLFGGLARFSHEKGVAFLKWRSSQEAVEAPGLFVFDLPEPLNQSKADRARFSLLREFDRLCKSTSLGVSINKNRYLCTPNPLNPINFWLYNPQSPLDKAPIR